MNNELKIEDAHGRRVTRREFVATAALAAWSTGCAGRRTRPPMPADAIVVDTHLHCFAGPDDTRFPYHERAPYRPESAATPEHLLRCMEEAGVAFAIVVHPEPYQDDHRYLEHCLEIGRGRLKGTCLVFADRPGSAEQLPRLARELDIVAARVHAYVPNRLPPFGKPELRALWKSATELGLAMQLHFEPRYAPGFEPLIKEFHDTTVIIDHLGRPFQGTEEEHGVVLDWARFDNTIIKLASIPSAHKYPHRDIRPVVERVIERFGPERMIYGGGFGLNATGRSYREYRDRVRELLSSLGAGDQRKVLGGNAARLFGFKLR